MYVAEAAETKGLIAIVTYVVIILFIMIGIMVPIISWIAAPQVFDLLFIAIMLLIFVLLMGVVWLCYRQKPLSYTIKNGMVIVERKAPWRNIEFSLEGVQSVQYMEKFPIFSLRLWGNGGVFSFTGRFWRSGLGLFRASVSNARDLVFIIGKKKLLISPVNPTEFIRQLELVTTGK